MALKKDGELKLISASIEKSQIRYLKENGMNQSKFMRQAVRAQQEGKWDYDFMDDS